MIESELHRTSVKAIIRDHRGRTLLVKEDGSDWILPGGGVEHGENISEAVAREMNEELGVSTCSLGPVVGTESFYADWRQCWSLWIVLHVEVADIKNIEHGTGVDDARFFTKGEIESLRSEDSLDISYRLAYKWALAA